MSAPSQQRAFAVSWTSKSGKCRSDVVYASSLKGHWETVAKHDLSPHANYYSSVSPFVCAPPAPSPLRPVDVMEPVKSPSESLAGAHYQELQQMAWRSEQGLALHPPIPRADSHSIAHLPEWSKMLTRAASPGDRPKVAVFTTALLDYYVARRNSIAAMNVEAKAGAGAGELEWHVLAVGEKIRKMDAAFVAAYPNTREINDLPSLAPPSWSDVVMPQACF